MNIFKLEDITPKSTLRAEFKKLKEKIIETGSVTRFVKGGAILYWIKNEMYVMGHGEELMLYRCFSNEEIKKYGMED